MFFTKKPQEIWEESQENFSEIYLFTREFFVTGKMETVEGSFDLWEDAKKLENVEDLD